MKSIKTIKVITDQSKIAYSKYIEGKEKGVQIVNFGWLLLWSGILSLFSVSLGFTVYALVLFLISLVSCLVCPCIGAVGIAGTAGVWSLLVVVDFYIALGFLILIGITGIVGFIYAFLPTIKNKSYVLGCSIIQIIISAIGVSYLSFLI